MPNFLRKREVGYALKSLQIAVVIRTGSKRQIKDLGTEMRHPAKLWKTRPSIQIIPVNIAEIQ
jgi:hypothetical protein